MRVLGLDFDNTLAIYDSLFYQLACDKEIISKAIPKTKKGVRDYLVSIEKEDEFTLLQGEVYGLHILQAETAENLLPSLRHLFKIGYKFKIISHKTQYPYKGPKYDLRSAAMSWLEKYSFFDKDFLGLSRNDVYFASTKEEKAQEIINQDCYAYVDDLPEILGMIPNNIKKILYNPRNNITDGDYIKLLDWANIKNIL